MTAIEQQPGRAARPPDMDAPAGGRAPRSVESRWVNRDRWPAIAMLSPNLILFTVFLAIPVLLAFILSFTNWSLVGFPTWAGLRNYKALLDDPAVPQAIETTMIFLALGVIPTVVLGLILAVFVNIRFPLVGLARTLYFVPAVVSLVASAVLWQWIYRPGQGILDYALKQLGLGGPAWLSSTHTALIALDVVGVWLSLPVAIVLYLSALQRIPGSVIEAATLDGAGAVRRLVYIIWPAVRPITVVVVIMAVLSFSNGSFDLVNTLTQGGPINATTTLIYYIYYQAFSNVDLGYAAALSVLQLLLFTALLALLSGIRRAIHK